jgi:MerR family transcriptional regulator/heat shock protein HspR
MAALARCALREWPIYDTVSIKIRAKAGGALVAPKGLTVGKRKRSSAIAPGRAVFTPSIASEILNLHPRTLMIYESENLIKPQRTATNRRRYSEDDIRRVRVIQFLTRQKGVNLAGVKYVLLLLQSLGNQGLDLNQVRELDTLQEVSGNGLSA